MKALVLPEYGRLEVMEAPTPTPADDELLIRVAACGICGSDVHGLDGSTGRRIPPLIMGHEAAGIVEAVGRNVTEFQPGNRVTFDSTVYCGRCHYCRRGQTNLCDQREVIGVSTPEFRRMGAFAEYVTVPAHIGYHLPAEVPFEHAALVEAASVSVHAISLTPIMIGDTVVIVGVGMIGLLALQAAVLTGAGQIVAVDVDSTRLERARSLGATHTIDSAKEDVAASLRALTAGRGADAVVECVGAPITVGLAIECARKGGTVTLVGNIAPLVDLKLQSVVTRQIRLQGSCASAGEYAACLTMMSRGAIRVEPLLSAVAPLEEGAQWFRRLRDREPGLLKVVLKP